jgi:hypothetical protein
VGSHELRDLETPEWAHVFPKTQRIWIGLQPGRKRDS